MKRSKVIAYKNAASSPVRVPWSAATMWLVMDRFHAPEWAWGVFWFFWIIMFVASIVGFCHEDQIDIFEEKPK